MKTPIQSIRLPRWLSLLPVLLTTLLLTGCPTVPKNGALLATKMTEGLKSNQAEVEKIITALANTQRAILDDNWEKLYIQVETEQMKAMGVTDAKNLTQDQRSTIAANMSEVWERLSTEINAVEAKLLSQSRANTGKLVEISETIQKYLLSVEKLDGARGAIVQKLSEITGLDLNELGEIAAKQLKKFNL